MTYDALSAWWWPYVFIALAGWLATDIWRWLGVLAGSKLKDDSALLVWVRCVATALVAAVVAKLVLYPSGPLSQSSVVLRVAAVALGFAAFLASGKRIYAGVFVALAALIAGLVIRPV